MTTTITKEQVFRRRSKVVAARDLPHVPAGTPGRVLYVAGVTWPRYHVRFDNGAYLSSLDATQLRDRAEYEAEQWEATVAARRAAAGVAGAGAAAAGSSKPADESGETRSDDREVA